MSTFYEEGRYTCEVVQQAMTKAKTGTPQFVLRFRVIGFTNGESVARQYERTCYRAITDKSVEYAKKDLEALGFTGGSLRRLDPTNDDYQDFVGQRVEMDCKHEADYQTGEPKEKWGVAWKAAGGGAIEGDAVDSAAYRQLDALFGVNKQQQRQAPAQPKKEAPLPVIQRNADMGNQEITDEDIPF